MWVEPLNCIALCMSCIVLCTALSEKDLQFSLNYVCTWIHKNEQIIICYLCSFISMCLSAVQRTSSVMICLHLSGLIQHHWCGWLNTFKFLKCWFALRDSNWLVILKSRSWYFLICRLNNESNFMNVYLLQTYLY